MVQSYVDLQTPNYIFGKDDLNDDCDPMNDNYVSVHHRVPMEFQNIDWDDITSMIHEVTFDETIDTETHGKLQRERQLLLSIRQKLETFQNTIRVSYQGHAYQLFKLNDFQQQTNTYITNSEVYFFVHKLKDIQNPELITQQCLATIVDRVEATLNDLYGSKCLNAVQYEMMFVKRARVQLNYLYFVPDYDKEKTAVFRPIVICHNGPTTSIADYLSELLWNMFDRHTGCQNLVERVNIVQTLENYVHNNFMQSTTSFVTFSMDDLSTVFRHGEVLNALEKFLHLYASIDDDFQHQNVSIDTILWLVRLVLDNQYFVYNHGLYRQVAGGASGSSLTLPLACIYLFFRTDLPSTVNIVNRNPREIFCRHGNDGFFTWNGSEDDLHSLFDVNMIKIYQSSTQHSIPFSIGSTVHFGHIYLSHRNGILHTKISSFNQSNIITENTSSVSIPIQPGYCTLSSIHKEIIRAACCCSHVDDFLEEFKRIESVSISSGISIDTFNDYVQELFVKFSSSRYESFSFANENDYRHFRQRTIQYQEQLCEFKQQRKLERKNKFIVYYSAELDIDTRSRLKEALEAVHEEWRTNDSIWNQTKFILVSYQPVTATTNDFLIDKRPPLYLLTLSEADRNDDDTDTDADTDSDSDHGYDSHSDGNSDDDNDDDENDVSLNNTDNNM